MDFENKLIVIAGGAGGIACACLARALAREVLVNGVAPGINLRGMPQHTLDVPE